MLAVYRAFWFLLRASNQQVEEIAQDILHDARISLKDRQKIKVPFRAIRLRAKIKERF